MGYLRLGGPRDLHDTAFVVSQPPGDNNISQGEVKRISTAFAIPICAPLVEPLNAEVKIATKQSRPKLLMSFFLVKMRYC
jgi:hypothetical protein